MRLIPLKTKKNKIKALSPIISVLLIILIAAILTGFILSWSKNATKTKLESTQNIKPLDSYYCNDAKLKIIDCTINAYTKDINLVVVNNSNFDLFNPTISIQGLDENLSAIQLYGGFTKSLKAGEAVSLSTYDDNSFNYSKGFSLKEYLDVDKVKLFNLSTTSCPNKYIDLKSCNVNYSDLNEIKRNKFKNYSFEDYSFDNHWLKDGHWWLGGGVSREEVVSAYQSINKESLLDSYTNLANPGTYDLFSTGYTAPLWTTETGWDFSQSTNAALRTGIIPEVVKPYGPAYFVPMSMLARYSDLNPNDDRQLLIGAGGRNRSPGFWIWPMYSSSTSLRAGNHALVTNYWSNFNGFKTEGIFTLAAQKLYFYNISDNVLKSISNGSSNYSGTINNYEFMLGYDITRRDGWSGSMKIQNAAIFYNVLNDSQVEEISNQINLIGNLNTTLNTDPLYVKAHLQSIKLDSSLGDSVFTQSINLNSTNEHTLKAFVYNGEIGNEGGEISSSEIQIIFNGKPFTPTYTYEKNGWWKLMYTGIPLEGTQSYGVKIKSGKIIYLDNIILFEEI